MTKSALLLFLCISVLVSVVVGVSKRSARWDAHVDHLHHLHMKRQATNQPGCSWQFGKGNKCTFGESEMRANDALGRRASSLLAPAESQGLCGSCWAFAAAHTFTDARSLQAGSLTLPLSPRYPAACRSYGNGCCGGNIKWAMKFFGDEGMVTQTCAPYDPIFDLYENYYNSKIVPKPPKPPISQTCPTNCADGTPFNPLNIRLPGCHAITTDDEVIAALNDGTVVSAGIKVSDHLHKSHYVCGVFCHLPGDPLVVNKKNKDSLHEVEIVDYGSLNGVDFWVMKNSWGNDWGEDGYFRMRRGDLTIGIFTVPDLSPGATQCANVAHDNALTCSPGEVANPESDELVMSAVEHALEEINENRSIPCLNNDQASSLAAFNSIIEATRQIVDGAVITAEVIVNVLGCDERTARATLSLTVILQDDDTFDLAYYDYEYNRGNVLTGSVVMVMAVVAAVLLL